MRYMSAGDVCERCGEARERVKKRNEVREEPKREREGEEERWKRSETGERRDSWIRGAHSLEG